MSMDIFNPEEMSSMFGFVTDEDRQKWVQERKRQEATPEHRARIQAIGNHVMESVMDTPEAALHARLTGQEAADGVNRQADEFEEVTVTETKTRRKAQPKEMTL